MKTNFINDFKAFINRGNAIDMAVGIIVGAAMTSVVNSLVKDVIMPPIGLLLGGIDFSQWFIVLSGGNPNVHYTTISAAQNAGASTLNIGVFLNSIVSFIITMFAIFIFVRIVNATRSKKAVTVRPCPYCQQEISKLATKCPFCCSAVKKEKIQQVEDTDVMKGIKSLQNKVKQATKAVNKALSK